ncbi:MAG: rhodanese-like domain-containing protein [Vicinamibacterales bacterium]
MTVNRAARLIAAVSALAVLAAPALAQVSNAELAAVPRISLAEFRKLHAAKQILAIDVRDPHAYENGHIPGALNVSFVDVEIMANRLLKESRPIVAYCACKDELTAARVAVQLTRVGVKGIRVLTGGWDGWTAGGGKVERTPPPGR